MADIWLADPDGSNRKQLTSNRAMNFSPVVTSDGRYVVFTSMRENQRNIWRMNIDGSNPVRLTSGLSEGFPALSPDGRWVIYTAYDGVRSALWRVSIDGGTPVQITDHVATAATVSPDGRWIAFTYTEAADLFAPVNRLAVIPFEGGSDMKVFSIPASGTVLTLAQWAPDGKSIHYTVNANNASNIWSQPVDGGPPKQITDFKEMFMTGFAWSSDGKQLACTRGTLVRDAILITDSR